MSAKDKEIIAINDGSRINSRCFSRVCKSERYYRRIFNSDTKGDVEKARTFVESDKEFNKLNEKQMMLRQKQC